MPQIHLQKTADIQDVRNVQKAVLHQDVNNRGVKGAVAEVAQDIAQEDVTEVVTEDVHAPVREVVAQDHATVAIAIPIAGAQEEATERDVEPEDAWDDHAEMDVFGQDVQTTVKDAEVPANTAVMVVVILDAETIADQDADQVVQMYVE